MNLDLHSASSHYSWLDKFLHYAVLNSINVRRTSFDLECSRYYSPTAQSAEQQKTDVLVCGLARSGTSLVTRLIEDSKAFRSLTYQDMPFIMAPNFWQSLNGLNRRSVSPVERFHKDGLINTLDSPEAFESVFWETFRDEPIRDDFLENPTSEEALAAFRQFKSVVANPARSGKSIVPERRYLSKNNNNLMRLAELSADKTNQLIVVFRNPLSVSRSLFEQHQFFSELQKRDKFSLKYMQWLAHHEFGKIHLPFAFAKPFMNPDLKPEMLDYWLDYWVAVHMHIMEACEKLNFKLLNFDRLCEAPAASIARLEKEIDQKLPDNTAIKINAKSKEERKISYSSSLQKTAIDIYQELEQSPKNI